MFLGNIFAKKRNLLARIGGIQKALAKEFKPGLLKLEKQLKKNLDQVLQEEESFWHQKSKEKWIKLGDRNTKYFHTTTLIRRQRNQIKCLLDANGVWNWDQASLKSQATAYFKKLFSSDQ